MFAKISARDNRGSSNFQITSLNLGYFAKMSTCDYRGSLHFQVSS